MLVVVWGQPAHAPTDAPSNNLLTHQQQRIPNDPYPPSYDSRFLNGEGDPKTTFMLNTEKMKEQPTLRRG